jgi:hypothetical protein
MQSCVLRFCSSNWARKSCSEHPRSILSDASFPWHDLQKTRGSGEGYGRYQWSFWNNVAAFRDEQENECLLRSRCLYTHCAALKLTVSISGQPQPHLVLQGVAVYEPRSLLSAHDSKQLSRVPSYRFNILKRGCSYFNLIFFPTRLR